MKNILGFILALVLGCRAEEDPVLPTITINDLETPELNSNHNVEIDLSLDVPFTGSVLVTVSTEDGTAVAGQDYQEIQNQNIIFQPGEISKVITVEIVGDFRLEEDEEFYVVINTVNNAVVGKSTATIKIVNDDTEDGIFIPNEGHLSPLSYDGYNLLWQDEFNSNELDPDYWNYEIGGNGWGNNELQYYTNENVFFKEGNLVIEARKENVGGRQYTSSRITTQDKFEFKYGRVDIRAALPQGQGIWPALWMLGANFSTVGWPHCGEIDVMEMIGGNGREKTVHGTAHWQDSDHKADYSGSYSLNSGTFSDKFHVFSIVWDDSRIQWLVDDILYHEMDITGQYLSEFRAPFFFIFNIAVGGNWPGSPDNTTFFPQTLIVDYIRVFQNE